LVVAVDGLLNAELVAVDLATGEDRWRTFTAHEFEDPRLLMGGVRTDGRYLYVAVEVYGTTVLADGKDTRGYGSDGTELWAVPSPHDLALVARPARIRTGLRRSRGRRSRAARG
jgi:outer membrane protein assembly factor BamB